MGVLEGRAPSRPKEEGSDRAEPSKILEFVVFWRTIGPFIAVALFMMEKSIATGSARCLRKPSEFPHKPI
ncbi:MAG: hypothetical protein A2X46_11260 [Lentisphaerae bacterium GWF2_57_35]|nr:MAG: hypothetical protein A2X46_11260 [Lentisphaerae bacterium GWF2_57_35]